MTFLTYEKRKWASGPKVGQGGWPTSFCCFYRFFDISPIFTLILPKWADRLAQLFAYKSIACETKRSGPEVGQGDWPTYIENMAKEVGQKWAKPLGQLWPTFCFYKNQELTKVGKWAKSGPNSLAHFEAKIAICKLLIFNDLSGPTGLGPLRSGQAPWPTSFSFQINNLQQHAGSGPRTLPPKGGRAFG